MRRKAGNSLVARAIAMGLSAAIIATASPVTTLADASEDQPAEVKNVITVENEITREETPVADNPGVSQAIDIAQDAAKEASPTGAEDENIKKADEKVDETKTDLNTAENKMKEAVQHDQNANDILNPAEGAPQIPVYIMVTVYEKDENGNIVVDENGAPVPVYEKDENDNIKLDENGNPIEKKEPQLVIGTEKDENDVEQKVTFNDAGQAVGADADDAINNASVAMSNKSTKSQAEKAQEDANVALGKAVSGFEAADLKLKEENQKVQDAQEIFNNAKAENDLAQQALKDAQDALDEALKQCFDENGNPILGKDGKPTYTGDVEEAEKALIAAKADADQKALAAKTALENFQKESIGQIVAQYDLIDQYVKAKRAENPDWSYDSKYWEDTRVLCNLMLKNYIRSGCDNLVVGDNFEVNLINAWEKDGEPYPKKNDDGTDMTDENGNVILWQDYKVATENGYVKFSENKNKGYVYDGNGNQIKGDGITKDWIRSGYSYIDENGKKQEDKNAYNHVVVSYKKLVYETDADGNQVTDDEGKPIPVYETDENGNRVQKTETVIEFYNYKTKSDGSIFIYQRDWSVEDDENNILVEAGDFVPGSPEIPAVPDTPESWANGTGEGSKKITVNKDTKELELPNETTHVVARPDNADGTKNGYWVIDTETSEVRETFAADDVNPVTVNNTVTTYSAIGTETKTYEKYDYEVESGQYNQKDEVKNHNISSDNLVKSFNEYKNNEEYKEVKLYYHHLAGSGFLWLEPWDEEIDTSNVNWWTEFKASIKDELDMQAFWVQTKKDVDDLNSPIMTTVTGILETITQNFAATDTTTNTVSNQAGSTKATTENDSNAYDTVEKAAIAAKNALTAQNTATHYYTDVNYVISPRTYKNKIGSHWEWFLGFIPYEVDDYSPEYTEYSYTISYTEVTIANGTGRENVVTSKKLYAADTYGTHNDFVEGSAKVEKVDPTPGQDVKYGQKITIQSDTDAQASHQKYTVGGDLAEYVAKLNTLKDDKKKLDTAASKVDAALKKVSYLKGEIAKLNNVALSSSKALDELSTELENANKALAAAQKQRDDLEIKVNKAKEAVAGIDLSRFNVSNEEESSGDDGDDSGSSSGTTPGAGGTIIAGGDIPVISFLPTTTPSGVAGVRTGRRASRSGVAGVRVEQDASDENSNTVANKAVEDKKTEKSDDKETVETDKKLVKVEDNMVPLADKPFEEGMSLNYLWLLLVAAAIIAGIVVYENHKRKAAVNNETKKYKK